MGNPVNTATNTVDAGHPYDIPFGADPSFYASGGSGQVPIFRSAPGNLVPKVNSLGTPRAPGLGTGMPAGQKNAGLPSDMTKVVSAHQENLPDVFNLTYRVAPSEVNKPDLASVPLPEVAGIIDIKA